nr:unnamed protein product [Digitaria exilis]CAB3503765.1 unnamed protein product [Digitaria exilis]
MLISSSLCTLSRSIVVPAAPSPPTTAPCAALSANHPQPDAFVSSSLVLASRLEEVHTLLQAPVVNLSKICSEGMRFGADPGEPLRNAAKRFCGLGVTVSPPVGIDHELSMKRLLLDKIHGFYLEAISRLPATLLRSRLHRALLKAGYCYGPFDPVSNILLNTIWYDTTFPAQHELKMDVILMESLGIVESRSLRGLVASMLRVFPALAMNDILRHLLKYSSFYGMIKNVGENFPLPVCASPCDCYTAATSACHPYPDAQASFLSGLPKIEETVMQLLHAKHTLSVDDVNVIKSLLGNRPHVGSVSQLEWSKLDSQSISDSCKEFEAHQSFICRRVEAALREHARRKAR